MLDADAASFGAFDDSTVGVSGGEGEGVGAAGAGAATLALEALDRGLKPENGRLYQNTDYYWVILDAASQNTNKHNSNIE